MGGYNAILISTIVDRSLNALASFGYNAILISTIVDNQAVPFEATHGYNAILISTIR